MQISNKIITQQIHPYQKSIFRNGVIFEIKEAQHHTIYFIKKAHLLIIQESKK